MADVHRTPINEHKCVSFHSCDMNKPEEIWRTPKHCLTNSLIHNWVPELIDPASPPGLTLKIITAKHTKLTFATVHCFLVPLPTLSLSTH